MGTLTGKLAGLAGWTGWLGWPPRLTPFQVHKEYLLPVRKLADQKLSDSLRGWLGGWLGWVAGLAGCSGWLGWLAGLTGWAGWFAWAQNLHTYKHTNVQTYKHSNIQTQNSPIALYTNLNFDSHSVHEKCNP